MIGGLVMPLVEICSNTRTSLAVHPCSKRREVVPKQRAFLLESKERDLLLTMGCWEISLIVYSVVPAVAGGHMISGRWLLCFDNEDGLFFRHRNTI